MVRSWPPRSTRTPKKINKKLETSKKKGVAKVHRYMWCRQLQKQRAPPECNNVTPPASDADRSCPATRFRVMEQKQTPPTHLRVSHPLIIPPPRPTPPGRRLLLPPPFFLPPPLLFPRSSSEGEGNIRSTCWQSRIPTCDTQCGEDKMRASVTNVGTEAGVCGHFRQNAHQVGACHAYVSVKLLSEQKMVTVTYTSPISGHARTCYLAAHGKLPVRIGGLAMANTPPIPTKTHHHIHDEIAPHEDNAQLSSTVLTLFSLRLKIKISSRGVQRGRAHSVPALPSAALPY